MTLPLSIIYIALLLLLLLLLLWELMMRGMDG